MLHVSNVHEGLRAPPAGNIGTTRQHTSHDVSVSPEELGQKGTSLWWQSGISRTSSTAIVGVTFTKNVVFIVPRLQVRALITTSTYMHINACYRICTRT